MAITIGQTRGGAKRAAWSARSIVAGSSRNRSDDVLGRLPVECVGAFPNALAHGHQMHRGTLTIHAESLDIDSSHEGSFTLYYDEIAAISLVPSPRRGIPAIQIRYREDSESAEERGFTAAPRGARSRLDGRQRVEAIATLLASAGIPLARDARGAQPRSLALSWPDARAHSSELMVWSGLA
ncbi:MAG TPA: hypothetical protein VFQ54_08300, partial [Thermomicrobiales bacterium]|nr:hypothetical protein [Thermomicrobiales bacterium]